MRDADETEYGAGLSGRKPRDRISRRMSPRRFAASLDQAHAGACCLLVETAGVFALAIGADALDQAVGEIRFLLLQRANVLRRCLQREMKQPAGATRA